MPRVLYIGSGAPWMGGAGYLVRQNLFLRALDEVAEVHLAMFDANPSERPVTALPSPVRKKSGTFGRLIGDVFGGSPRMFRGYELDVPQRAVSALHPEQFDAVFAYRIDFAHFAGVLNHPRLILDIDDPEHLRWERRVRATTGGDGDWRTRRDLEKLRRFEHAAESGAKLAFVCQANDAKGWPVEPVVVPNCVEVIENPERRESGPRVVFVGNTTGSEQAPNVDAVRYFLADIWPGIVRAVPEARVQIVGAIGDVIRKMALAASNVELTGFSRDLGEIYAQASISVAPIRFGTGTRIKILEAFGHACAVVSTVAGADGIEVVSGKDIELAGNAEDFITRCVHLLKDSTARQRIGQGGHELAKRLYDRKVQHQRLVKILGGFLESQPLAARSS